jgi:ATP-dependent HslUV protease ATP-binding subunit HslU
MERILEDISFDADTMRGEKVEVDVSLIEEKLEELVENEDSARYIL